MDPTKFPKSKLQIIRSKYVRILIKFPVANFQIPNPETRKISSEAWNFSAGWKISLQIPRGGLEEIGFSATFLHHRLYSPSGKVLRREEGREEGEEKDKERRGREGKEKKGTKADGKVWRPSPSYRPPNYFRLVNAIFLKARTICIKAYICVTFKNTFK